MEGELPESAPASFEVRVLPDPEALAAEAATEFAAAAAASVGERGLFRVALSGGSTPRLLHRHLTEASVRSSMAWGSIRFFFGDERCVPPDHDRSNYRMARETLFDPLGIPPVNVLRMRGEEEPGRAAADYERTLETHFAGEPVIPRFDLVFLGVGPDGHTASLFPGSMALEEKRRWVVADFVARFSEWRLTLTYPVFNAARRVVFLVAGQEKRAPVSRILKKERGYRDLPAAGIEPRHGSLLWVLDEAAASKL